MDLFPVSFLLPVVGYGHDLSSIVLKVEKHAILAAFNHTRASGNTIVDLHVLGVSRPTLNEKIKLLDLRAEGIAKAVRA